MKKILLVIAALLAFGFSNAQETTPETKDEKPKLPTTFGILAGLNYAGVTNPGGGTYLANYHAGFFAAFPINEKFAIQPQVLFSGQGLKVANGAYHLNYINVPVLAKFRVWKSYSALAGPQIGFLVHGKASATSGGSVDVRDLFKTVDYGLNFGLAYDIEKDGMIQFTYNLGLAQLQKDLELGESASRNSVFQFSIGYNF